MEFPFLEIHLVAHCNLRCRGCNHAAPALPREFVPVAEIACDLVRLAAGRRDRRPLFFLIPHFAFGN